MYKLLDNLSEDMCSLQRRRKQLWTNYRFAVATIGASRPVLQLADEYCITDGSASTADQFMDALMLSTSAADVGTSHGSQVSV